MKKIFFYPLFFLLTISISLKTFGAVIYSGNFNISIEDVPANQLSDQDLNDIFFNYEYKIHVDPQGKIIKSTITVVPIAFGAEHDLKVNIGSGISNADLLIHDTSSTSEHILPFTLYTADSENNELFVNCTKVKMINVIQGEDSCIGNEKSFTLYFPTAANRIALSSYESPETFITSLFTVQNITIGQTIDSTTGEWGFQNMLILPEDVLSNQYGFLLTGKL